MFARRGGPSIYNQSGGGNNVPFSDTVTNATGGTASVWTGTSLTITHGLDTLDPIITLRNTVTAQLLTLPIVSILDANSIELEFVVKPIDTIKVTIRI